MNVKEAFRKIENTFIDNNAMSNLEFDLSHNNLDCNNADEMRECLKIIKNAIDFKKIAQEYKKDPNVVIGDIIYKNKELEEYNSVLLADLDKAKEEKRELAKSFADCMMMMRKEIESERQNTYYWKHIYMIHKREEE